MNSPVSSLLSNWSKYIHKFQWEEDLFITFYQCIFNFQALTCLKYTRYECTWPSTIHLKFITKCDSLFYYKVRWFVITKCDRTTHKTHTCNCMFFCTQGIKPLKLTWQPDDAGNVTRVFVRTLLLAYPWKRSQPVKTNQTIPPRVYFYVAPEITYKLWRNIHKRGGSYRWSVHRY